MTTKLDIACAAYNKSMGEGFACSVTAMSAAVEALAQYDASAQAAQAPAGTSAIRAMLPERRVIDLFTYCEKCGADDGLPCWPECALEGAHKALDALSAPALPAPGALAGLVAEWKAKANRGQGWWKGDYETCADELEAAIRAGGERDTYPNQGVLNQYIMEIESLRKQLAAKDAELEAADTKLRNDWRACRIAGAIFNGYGWSESVNPANAILEHASEWRGKLEATKSDRDALRGRLKKVTDVLGLLVAWDASDMDAVSSMMAYGDAMKAARELIAAEQSSDAGAM